MKKLFVILLLVLGVGSCATASPAFEIQAKFGQVACYDRENNLIQIPFKGNVVLMGSWVKFVPLSDKEIKEAMISGDCAVMILKK